MAKTDVEVTEVEQVTTTVLAESIEVTNKSEVLVSEGFNCESVETAVAALRHADRLERNCG